MSGLIKFKFGFENHLKICFEKLEKEKEMNFFSSRAASYRSPQLGLPSPRAARFLLPRPLPHGPSPVAVSRPVNARASESRVEPLTAADMWDPPVSVRFPFLSSSSGSFHRRTPLSSFTDPNPPHFPCFRVPSGYKNGTPALFRSHPILLEPL
jgi:hypothetical protein